MIKQGVLKYFPNLLSSNQCVLVSTCSDTNRSFAILEKNLKSIIECNSNVCEELGMYGKTCYAYLGLNNSMLMMHIHKGLFKGIRLQSQAKPQLIMLSKNYTLIWFKTMAQLQVFNNFNLTIEQSFFLKRGESWLQI